MSQVSSNKLQDGKKQEVIDDIDELLYLSYDAIKPESPNKKFHYTTIEKDSKGNFKRITHLIPFDLYSRMLYESIETNMASMIYEELMQDTNFPDLNKCSLQIDILVDSTGNGTLYYKGLESDIISYNLDQEIVDDIIKDIDSCGEFIAIDMGIGDDKIIHSTFLMVENIKQNMIFNYYDPHGSEESLSLDLGIDKILDSLVKGIIKYDKSKKIKRKIMINKNGTSCPRGMQSVVSEYDIGYCLIFTMLWMSSVLYIINYMIKNNVYIPSPEWIQKVEMFYIKKSEKELYEKVVGFGAYLFDLYIKKYKKEGKDILKRFAKNPYSIKEEDKKMELGNKVINLVDIKEEYLTEKEIKEMKEQDERLQLVKSIGIQQDKDEKEELKQLTVKKGKGYKTRLLKAKKELKKKVYPMEKSQISNPISSMEAYELAVENERREYEKKKSKKKGNFIGSPCKINTDCKSNCCSASENDETDELEYTCSPREYCE